MLFTIRFKSADGLLQRDFNPKEFKQAFGHEFNADQDVVNFPVIEVFIPKSGYLSDVNIFNLPAQYRSYRRQETLTEPIVIYNPAGREVTTYKTVVHYQEILG